MLLNPVQKIRQRLRKSQRNFGISRSVLQRLENGHYETVSDGMIDDIVAEVEHAGLDFGDISEMLVEDYGTPYLDEAYQGWRKNHREATGRRVTWPTLEDLTGPMKDGRSPMGAFAGAVSGSVHKFANDFCVQAPTLARYIEGKYEYIDPPQSIRDALTDAGYPESEELFGLQREWIDRER